MPHTVPGARGVRGAAERRVSEGDRVFVASDQTPGRVFVPSSQGLRLSQRRLRGHVVRMCRFGRPAGGAAGVGHRRFLRFKAFLDCAM